VKHIGPILLLAILAGCITQGTATSPQAAADAAGSWVLVAGSGPDGEIRIFDGHRVTLTIRGGEVGGTSACNQYGGTIAFSGNAVRIGEIGGTEMACEPDVMATESAYATALMAVTRWGRDGDQLRFTGDGVDLRFELLPPVPDEEMVGTTWVLESLIQGEAASSVQGEAFLMFTADGTFSGMTGCREIRGNYVVNGDVIDFVDLAAEGDCPPERQAQDRLVIEVLEGGFSASVDGGSLTLTDNAGQGLTYQAAPGIE
jgi:heat shock protein HslJ